MLSLLSAFYTFRFMENVSVPTLARPQGTWNRDKKSMTFETTECAWRLIIGLGSNRVSFGEGSASPGPFSASLQAEQSPIDDDDSASGRALNEG